MNYNIKDIEKYIQYFNYEEHFTSEDAYCFEEELERNLPNENFYCETGATKFVIIPENLDYVIKIPFNGQYDYSWGEEDDAFVPFEQGGKDYYDYLDLEVTLLKEWKEKEMKRDDFLLVKFLLPIESVDEINGFTIYIQKKAISYSDLYEEGRKVPVSGESKKKVTEISKRENLYNNLPLDWLASCYNELNDEIEMTKFLRSINCISDLHRGNIGYCGNTPVIIDYGGYYE